jgi:hypothetical protein
LIPDLNMPPARLRQELVGVRLLVERLIIRSLMASRAAVIRD